MKSLDFINENNVVSPYNEMLSYETLSVIKDIKDKQLKEYFNNYTPSETLKEIFSQPALFSSKEPLAELQNEVELFLKTSLKNELNSFLIVTNKNFQYPESLNKAQIPIGLFYYKGHLDILKNNCISVVGTRKPSEEGIKKAEKISKELVDNGFTIVSGLAAGIDTIAHETAIANNGDTIGVIGTPINEYYPKQNKELQDKIAKDFLLMSQVPFYKYAKEPFTHRKFHFPKRNKIMASISKATIIVEASDTSGSLIQARECIRQNKKLFILDSCFDNPNNKWTKKFEKKGAIRVKKIQDILQTIDE